MVNNTEKEHPPLTLGIFAHANAGKTTLTEHLLYHTNVIKEIGRVDTGNTITDSMKIERERGISVRAVLVTFNLGDKKIQLIDTPGHIDFSAEVERAMQVLDSAVLVISGVEGVEPQTLALWKYLKENKIPSIIFINKMDRKGADYISTINDIKEKLEKRIIPLINIEETDDSFHYRKYTHDQMAELLAELDDTILEKFLSDPKQITEEMINSRISELARNGEIFPVIGGSALKNEGIELLLDCVSKYFASKPAIASKDFSAFVYMIRIEEGKKNFYTKILSGDVHNRSSIKGDDNEQKIRGLYKMDGTVLVPIEKASSGEIVVINGLDATSGQFIGEKPIDKHNFHFVNPLINMNVIPKDDNQSIKLVEALHVLNEEDPYLEIAKDKLSGQACISLMGEIQAQVIATMLLERFNIDAELINPTVIHKERPTKEGEGLASYTKVSAVKLEVKPLPMGSGLVYRSKLSTDYLLKKYQRQVERLVKQYISQGVYGWEVTDAEISLVDGRFDSMGSEPMHFNIATPLALMRALKNSRIKILEPISKYSISIPRESLSLVIKTLSSINSSFEIIKDDSERVTIEGEAKAITMINFSNTLMRLTGGLGTYSSYLSRYESSENQNITRNFVGPDPRNETVFVINEMNGSLDALDKPFTKKKRESSAKFKRKQKEKLYANKK